MIAAPLFHAWGFAHFTLGISLASTRRAQAQVRPEEATLSLTAQHECDGARRRAGDDPAHPRARRRGARPLRPRRRCAPCRSRAPRCPARSRDRWMDHFGENLYNLYGSTEVAWATIATPQDLREAPGTAGKPPRGTSCKLYDERRQAGRAGRDRPHLRRQRRPVRGLHRRRQQGRDRRPAVLRRRRPLRRRRAACSSTAATTT